MRKWKFEVLGEELLDVWTLDIIGLLELDDLKDLLQHLLASRTRGVGPNSTYVNRTETGTMSGSHVLVESLNSISS